MADMPPLPAGATPVSAAAPPPPPPGATPIPPPPKGAEPVAKPTSGIMSQIGDAAMAIPRAQGAALKGVYDETLKEGRQNVEDIKGDFTAPIQHKDNKTGKVTPAGPLDYAARAGKTALDVVNRPFIPIHAASKQVLGRAVEEQTGGKVKADTVANVTDLAVPFAGELRKMGGAVKDLAAAGARKGAEALSPKPPLPKGAMPVEGPLTEPPALTQPRKFEDQLFQLESNRVADKLDVMKAVKNAPDVKPETWEKLYHHEENPDGVPLSPEEKAIYDQHIAPLKAESDKLSQELERLTGAKLNETASGGSGQGYTPRYPVGKTRSFSEVLAQWKKGKESEFQGGANARSMRQTVDAQKSRRFYNAVSPDGERVVVHIGKDGTVSAFDGSDDPAGPDFGRFSKGQKIAPGAKLRAEGNTWRLENATTKEIEGVASTRYHKNLLANRLDNLAKLRSAVRNAKFIEAVKSSPEWGQVAAKVTDHPLEPPETNGKKWIIPSGVPQFGQYYMEPELAHALEDARGRQRDLDGLTNGLDKIGNVVKGSIFWNPIPHMRNVANHFFVEKGLAGSAKDLATGSSYRSMLRAARAVMTQNEDYMRALRAGASLPYARTITSDLHKALTTKLGEDVAANPKEWSKIAQIAGYANPVEMVKALYKTSNKALWSFGDILSVARQMELAEKGVPFAKAIKMTEEHMPNYRVPGQVLGSRMISQLLTTPVASMFGRYQYNRLASYMNMAKDMVSSETSIKDKAAAMDKLAMLGVMLTLYYPALDKAWQGITGNKNAKVTRPGAASVPQAAYDVATGTKGPAQGVQSVFSPGIVEAPIEAYHGRYLYSGQPIAYPENLTDGHPDQFARDIGSWIGSKISPVGQAQKITEGSQSAKQFLLSQIGVQTPSDEQAAAKQKYGNRDAKSAARRAVKKANQRGN